MKSVSPALALILATFAVSNTLAQISPPASPEAVKVATDPDAPVSPKLSTEVSQQLTDKLPKYATPEPEKPAAAVTAPEAIGTPEAETDPDVLHLNKVTVTPRKRPRLTDDVIMTTKAYNDKLARERLSSLDRNVLNKFTLPAWFGGVSAAERAREERNREQRTQMANDVFGLAKVVEISDPEQAKVLRDAMNRP